MAGMPPERPAGRCDDAEHYRSLYLQCDQDFRALRVENKLGHIPSNTCACVGCRSFASLLDRASNHLADGPAREELRKRLVGLVARDVIVGALVDSGVGREPPEDRDDD